MSGQDWRHRGACVGLDSELFFPTGKNGPALLQIAEAKIVCGRCHVASECLTWALESGQDAGVWGGMSEDERRSLKRRDARQTRGQRALTAPLGEHPSPEQLAAAGRQALRDGMSLRDVAAKFGVSRYTVERWADVARVQAGAR